MVAPDNAGNGTAGGEASVFLLTGSPGTGKTSLIKQAVSELAVEAGGFYTGEIRQQRTRLGFRLVTLDGREATLARTDFGKRFRVGKYGIDLAGLENVGVPALRAAAERHRLVVIDEIGRMEILSADFRKAVTDIIEGGHRVFGTIMLQPHPFADAVKRHPRVRIVMLTRRNFQDTLEEVRAWLGGR